jgi:hypothetical protein
MVPAQTAQLDLAPQGLAGPDLDPAEGEDERHLALGEVVGHLVGGDAVLVEASGLVLGLEDGDVVAQHGQAVGAGQAGRAQCLILTPLVWASSCSWPVADMASEPRR